MDTPPPLSSPNTGSSQIWKWSSILLGVLLVIVVIGKKSGSSSISPSESKLVGKWVTKETVVPNPGVFDKKGEATVIERTMVLDRNGASSYVRASNGRLDLSFGGPWAVEGSYLVLQYELQGQPGMPNVPKFLAGRIVRISAERLVLIYEDGAERIFDRVQ